MGAVAKCFLGYADAPDSARGPSIRSEGDLLSVSIIYLLVGRCVSAHRHFPVEVTSVKAPRLLIVPDGRCVYRPSTCHLPKQSRGPYKPIAHHRSGIIAVGKQYVMKRDDERQHANLRLQTDMKLGEGRLSGPSTNTTSVGSHGDRF